MSPTSSESPGFGLGLRTPHYGDFLAGPQPLDWLEIITDNFLVEGGKPLAMLDRFRRDYPMAMHGVAMSIGSAQGLDLAYLARVKALADRVQPMWVSDHLCWTGTPGRCLHDLYPLPYTEEAARRVIAHIRQAQDVLQRRLVLENVSSYLRFRDSASAEWEFLTHVVEAADCDLLLDVNNLYVSSVNHGFDPQDYLHALPAARVRQIHLAGHSRDGTHIIDTHDHPVAPEVWALYASACQRFGAVATMIERDDHIPPLSVLLAELGQARDIARGPLAGAAPAGPSAALRWPAVAATPLIELQHSLSACLLDQVPAEQALALLDTAPLAGTQGLSGERGLAIYRNAYRARLAEVLADAHPRLLRYMGGDTFEAEARLFAVTHPPAGEGLGRYGAGLADFLRARYPRNLELYELARLDWDLRACFDGPDRPALSAEAVQADTEGRWLQRSPACHPGLVLREVSTNVVALWQALEADDAVPAPESLPQSRCLGVWRQGHQPHFRTLDVGEAIFLRALQEPGGHLALVIERFNGGPVLPEPAVLAGWLQRWWAEGWLDGH